MDEVFPEGWDAEADASADAVAGSGAGVDQGGPRDFVADWDALRDEDPEVAGAMANEVRRERSMLRLIASENYASPAVLAALASTFNDKYAEGYPGRRYYGGCEYIDVVENLAIERAKRLFGADHANVQPHAGASANLAVYGAFLNPSDATQKVLGLVLAHGGHLTHGSPVNVSGKWFHFVGYEVDRETETIDLDRVRDLALEHRPRIILAGFTAYPRTIDFAGFRRIADEVGAIFMVDASHFIGLVAGGAYPSPVPYADVVTFTTHKTLRGPRGAIILCREEHAKAIDKAVFPMMQGGPLGSAIAAKAVALHEAMQPSFAEYAERTVRTARALAASLVEHGLRCVSGGTDSHLALVDLRPIGMTGTDAERLCEGVGIALNKNAIPFDPLPPNTSSGIRVGTPGPATLGMDAAEMAEIGGAIGEVLRAPDDASAAERARRTVRELMTRFPPYPASRAEARSSGRPPQG
jgi:glycine hydroxymethyltransferase